ncbi:MAG: DUF1559 domain-containing protein [Planctomycetaceae bacterium]|nr:DUF1559 domain-containing protein [Planctomycetaceae bacterium]
MTEAPSPVTPKITPEANVEKPRKIGCITYMWVVALVLMFLVWYNGLRSVPLRVSPETTYITEPLTPDGKHVDYVAAFRQRLYPPEIATDDNGYRLVFRRLRDAGHSPALSPEVVQKYCDELGLDPNLKADLTYRDIYAFIDHVHKMEPELLTGISELVLKDRLQEKEQLNKRRAEDIPADETLTDEEKAAWESILEDREDSLDGNFISTYDANRIIDRSDELHQFPLVLRWVEENSPALDLVAEAVAKPVYFMPMISEAQEPGLAGMINISSYLEARSYARGFHPRARYRVAAGDIDGAIDDMLACYRLGRHFERQGTMVTSLVGAAIEGMAVYMAPDANLTVPASEEQLQRLAESIRNLPPGMTVEEILEAERFFALDSIQSLSSQQTSATNYTGVHRYRSMTGAKPSRQEMINEYLLDHLGYDWNIVARRYNESLDAAISGTAGVSTSKAWRPWNWLTVSSRSHELANFLFDMVPNSRAFREAHRRKDCTDNMKQIVLAMLIYERRNGTLPPAWTVDAEGRPLHSWRVLLLPYLGDEALAELYSQIRLDEPWDSEHNRQFHSRNLDIYRCPSTTLADGETSYTVVVGEETAFNDSGTGRKLSGFGPKSGDMLLLGEMPTAICWMSPHDMTWERAKFSDFLAETRHVSEFFDGGTVHTGGGNFAFRDGSVRFISKTMNGDKFSGMILGIQREADDTVTLRVIYEQKEEQRRKEREEELKEQERLKREQWRKEQAEKGEGFGDFEFPPGFENGSWGEPPKGEPVEPSTKSLGRSLMRRIIPQKQEPE